MPMTAFDTHKYAKQLKQAGVPDEQVEAQVSALAEAFQSGFQDLATKQDFHLLKQDFHLLKQDIATVEKSLKQEIATVEKSLKQEIATVEKSLKQEIATVDQGLKHDIALVRQEMKQLETRVFGELLLLKWMVGVTLAGVVSILVRSFFRIV